MPTNLLPIKSIDYQNVHLFLSLEEPPPHVQALVYEQDTALVLQPPHLLIYPTESTNELIQQALHTPPHPPGTVVVKSGHPLHIHAVIHDLDSEPTWQPQWITQALLNILQTVEQCELYSLAMPLLGTTHGNLPADQFFQLLKMAMTQFPLVHLKQLWLIVDESTTPENFEKLYQDMAIFIR